MKKLLIIFAVLFMLTPAVFAEDFDGYVVKLKENTYENMTTVSLLGDEMTLFSDMEDSEIASLMAEEIPTVSDVSSDHLYLKADDKETLDMLIEMGVVERYEEDVYFELCGFDVTDNAKYSAQEWFYDYINADFAWNAGICGDDVKVAVVDSGVYPNEDIKDNLLKGKNYYQAEESYDPDNTVDTHYHGTMVAGFIAAQCNSLSTVGLSFNAKIVPLRVSDGSKFSLSYVISAIYDAVDVYDCDVINMSFGSESNSEGLYDAILYAIKNNVIVVAAAGNYGDKTPAGSVMNPILYPAYYPEVVSVANAESANGTLQIYKSSTFNDGVDIAAPGTKVASLDNSNSGARVATGTSFSSPIVAAAAALAKSVKPEISQSEFKRILKDTADSSYITAAQDSKYWGAGLLNVEGLLKTILSGNDHYMSPVHYYNGEYFAAVTNPSAVTNIDHCSVIFNKYDNGILYTDKVETFPLNASVTKELKLSDADVILKCVTDHIPGDVNGDEDVNNKDASAVLKKLAGYSASVVEAALDVNGDGNVNNRDATAILKYLVGYKVALN